jgi:DNA-binding SARP family transcriptional activator
MRTTVHLLGTPRITRDGSAVDGPRGRKAWGLLAYLLLAERPPSRQRLVSMLFERAEDPRGALRWNLAEMRRALGGRITIGRDPLAVALADDIEVDAFVVRKAHKGNTSKGSSEWGKGVASDLELPYGELLEGLAFDDSPAFETWLSVERQRLVADCWALAYRLAVELLAAGRPEAAIRIACRAVEDDRLNADLHAVIVASMVRAGDVARAREHVARCTDLFRRELGVGLPEVVAAAAVPPIGAPASVPAVRSLLDLADASLSAGSVATGISQLRRAVAGAGDGDPQLTGRAKLALASALIHAEGGRGREVATLLHDALACAQRCGDAAVGAAACRELAFLSVQKGQRAEVDHWLDRAESLTASTLERARIRGVRGMSLSDSGDYEAAAGVLSESIEYARSCGNRRQVAWSQSMIGRIRLLRGEPAQAAHILDEALEIIRAERWTAFAPFPQSLRAEAAIALGDLTTAREELDYAWVQATESGDQCWIATVTYAQAMLAIQEGRDALAVCRTGLAAAPWYLWLRARLVDLAASLTSGSDAAALIDELEQLAGAGSMRELTVRALIHRSRIEGPEQLRQARIMADGIDNPALRRDLTKDIAYLNVK